MQATFETITDWMVVVSMVITLGAVYVSWLATFRAPTTVSAGKSLWFSLPAGVQIAAGLAITILGIYLCYRLWIPLPVTVQSSLSVLLRIVGLVLVCGGEACWFWARWTLGAMMGLSTSSATQLQAHHRLIRNGPYAFVRHPMYLSYWLLLAGLMVMYHTWTLLVLIPMIIASLYRRARREEKALAATFGGEWQTYAACVPLFVPRWKQPR
jgi:protein-S-isoprenylcysteine O-methyltransferase Ste14